MQGLSFLENLSICLRHPILLQQVLSPGWKHHFHTKGVVPARILEQLPAVRTASQVNEPNFRH
jgi:hypothetical protein